MIQVGDVVRYKNSYLKIVGRRAKPKGPYSLGKKFRGRQRLHVVVSLSNKYWDWRRKLWNQIAVLDNGDLISVLWLSFVRRPNKPFPPMAEKV